MRLEKRTIMNLRLCAEKSLVLHVKFVLHLVKEDYFRQAEIC
jgi:hypothetical protein